VAGRARACITLTEEAGRAWAKLSRSEKVKLAEAFSQLVLHYAETHQTPPPHLKTLLEAAQTIATAYEICREENQQLREQLEKLGGTRKS